MPSVAGILFYSFPVVIALAATEAAVLWFARPSYDWRASLASLPDLLVRKYFVYVWLPIGIADPLVPLAWQHRIATVPLCPFRAVALLFFGQEVCYLSFHLARHRG